MFVGELVIIMCAVDCMMLYAIVIVMMCLRVVVCDVAMWLCVICVVCVRSCMVRVLRVL